MNVDHFLRALQPLFDLGGNVSIRKTLNIILISAVTINGLYIVDRLISGEPFFRASIIINFALLVIQFGLLYLVRLGHVYQASLALIFFSWTGMTYQAWMADGVRDTAVTVYVVIILVAALVIGWRVALSVAFLSILAVWGFAIGEVEGLRAPMVGSPVSTAWELTAIFLLIIALVYLVFATVRDAVAAERKGDERFRKVFEVSPVAINLTTLKDGKLIEANDAYWILTGFDPETSLGKTTVELTIWDSELERQDFVRKILEQKSIYNPSYEFVNEKGETRHTVAFYELIDSSGEPTILSMFYDVTDQVVTQDALRRSEARTRALLEAIPDMIFEMDRDGKILQFVPSSTLSPIMAPEEFLGKNISQVMPPDVADQTIFAIQRALGSGLLQVFEYQLHGDKELSYYEASVVRNDAETALAMVRDVTVRRWASTERDNLIDELERKNAELEQFTYTVSHDLKSPLITISGFLGFIREDVKSGNRERLERSLQRINDAAKKMQKLLADLLELSRVGRMINEPETVPFGDLVSETLETLHGRITQNSIQVQVEDGLPFLHVDKQRIQEVLQNLIDNAAKFMADQPNPVIVIGQAGELNGLPILFVRDNGIGIAPEFKDRIFGLFNKLDASTDGTGIGLALVKRIIEFHGGRIWVESVLGKGATFFFTLPVPPTFAR